MAMVSSSDRPGPALEPGSGPVTGRLTAWADRWRWALLLIVIGAYVLAFNGQFRGQPDAGLHLTIARSIHQGDGFFHPLGDHVRANPGLAYLLAGVMAVGGPESFALMHAVMAGVALLTLAVTFAWFRLHLGRPAAVLLTATLGLSTLFIEHAFYLMPDMLFLLGGMLFLLGWDRLMQSRSPRPLTLLLLAAGTGIMVVSRTVAITFLGAVALALLWQMLRAGDRRAWITGGVVLGLCGAGLAAVVLSTLGGETGEGPRMASDMQIAFDRVRNLNHTLGEELPTNAARLFFDHMADAVTAIRVGDVLNSVIAVAAIGLGLALFPRHPLAALLVLAFVVQTLLFFVTERYYLAILPVLLLGWWQGAILCERQDRERTGRWRPGTAVCVFMLLVWIGPNLVRTAKFIAIQRQPNYLAHESGGRYGAELALRDWLRDSAAVPPGATIVTDHRDLHVLVYLTMPLEVSVTSHRHVEAGAALGEPVYVLEPIGQDMRELIDERDWELGEPVVTVPTSRPSETLHLRPVGE